MGFPQVPGDGLDKCHPPLLGHKDPLKTAQEQIGEQHRGQ